MSKYFKISVFSIALAFLFVTSSFLTSSFAQPGDDAPNLTTVFAIVPEAPGPNCANGGSLIASGLDINGNGFLNFNEVQQTGYACDGDSGQTGPPGPAGPQGPQGIAGADGAPGATGPQGPAGPQGDTGPAGPAGADGAQGPQGETGPAGPQGEQGIAGTDGADGATGPEGPAGNDGAVGATGPEGPEGPQGPAGADGADGMTPAFLVTPGFGATPGCPDDEFGTFIFIGFDTDGSGALEIDESVDVFTVCDGGEGPQGPSGGAGRWEFSTFDCDSEANCSATKLCDIGETVADVTCGVDSLGIKNIWLGYVGADLTDQRVARCGVRNDSNSTQTFEFGAYCVDE